MNVTREQIDSLPPIAKIAFAAHCARTAWQAVVPGFWQEPSEVLGEALAYAEGSGVGEPIFECPIVPKASSPPVAVALTEAVEWALETGIARDEHMTDAAMRSYNKARQATIHSYALKTYDKAKSDHLAKLTAGMP